MNVPDPALVVLAWGNESRADDGVGPLLAHRIVALQKPQVVVIEDLQLHIEHVMDLVADVPALFIDASVGIEDGFSLERIGPVADRSVTTHSISPQALLQLYESTLKRPAPDAFLLQVAGRNFELGETISDATMRAADAAWLFLEEILSGPPGSWLAALQSPLGQAAVE